jgi:hypothetical protein
MGQQDGPSPSNDSLDLREKRGVKKKNPPGVPTGPKDRSPDTLKKKPPSSLWEARQERRAPSAKWEDHPIGLDQLHTINSQGILTSS